MERKGALRSWAELKDGKNPRQEDQWGSTIGRKEREEASQTTCFEGLEVDKWEGGGKELQAAKRSSLTTLHSRFLRRLANRANRPGELRPSKQRLPHK